MASIKQTQQELKELQAIIQDTARALSLLTDAKNEYLSQAGEGAYTPSIKAYDEDIKNLTSTLEEYKSKADSATAALNKLKEASEGVNNIPRTKSASDVDKDNRTRELDAQTKALDLFKKKMSEAIPKSVGEEARAKIIADLTAKYKELGVVMDSISLVTFGGSTKDGILTMTGQIKAANKETIKLAESYNMVGQNIKTALIEASLANPQYAKAFEAAAKQGFSPDSLKKTFNQGGDSGVTKLQFRETGATDKDIRQTEILVDKFGNVIPSLSKEFKTFTQGIVRNTRELLKWSLAMSVVYTPMQKMGELFTLMVENETKLAESMTAVSASGVTSGAVFDNVYESAKRAGEGVTGTLDAFTQAYRATGRLGDSPDRMNQSLALLDDSLKLSKLSTLNQADAIDTLSAALYQQGMNLDQGTKLLDKWVRVSKYANVDLATLSTGFSILGDTADAAGLDIDKLNGLIAAIATTTGVASSSGIANIAKAMIGGVSTPAAAKELDRLGISVTNLTGDTRDYLDIMRQISEMRGLGVISNSDFGKLTLALGGGGTRRQKDVAALIESFSLVDEVAAQSALSTNDSSEAMALQLDTVQTSSTRLSNAFQQLANDLGTDGGLLDGMSALLDTAGWIVEKFDSMTKALGKAGPALYSLALMSAFVGKNRENTALYGGLFGTDVLGTKGVSGIASSILKNSRLRSAASGVSTWATKNIGGYSDIQTSGSMLAGFGSSDARNIQTSGTQFTGMTGIGRVATGVGVGAIAGAQNLAKGDYLEAGADMAGGLLGAIAGGSVIWAMVGTAVAEAFVRTTMTYDKDFSMFFAETYGKGGRVIDETTPMEDAKQSLTAQAYRAIALSNFGMRDSAGEAIAKSEEGKGIGAIGSLNAYAYSLIEYAKGVRNEEGGVIDPNTAAMKYIEDYLPELADTLRAQERAARGEAGLGATDDYRTTSKYALTQQSMLKNDRGTIDSMVAEVKQQLLTQLISGEITTSEYNRKSDLSGFGTKATGYVSRFGDELMDLSPSINNAEDAYRAFLTVTTEGTAEQTQRVTALTSEMDRLQSFVDSWNPDDKTMKLTIEGEVLDYTLEEVKNKIDDFAQQSARIIESAFNEIQFNAIEVPSIVGNINEPKLSAEDESTAYNKALKAQRADLVGGGFYTPEQYQMYKEKQAPFRVPVSLGGGGTDLVTREGVNQQYYDAATEGLINEGLITDQTKQMSIQQVDIASSRSGELGAALDWSKNLLEGMGYQLKPEEMGIIYSDYITDTLHADNLQMRLALQRLVDINQEQLDGMYNIPDGATFWVPLTAASYGRGGSDSSGFGGSISGGGETETTTEVDPYAGMEDWYANQDRINKEMLDEVPALQKWAEYQNQTNSTTDSGQKSLMDMADAIAKGDYTKEDYDLTRKLASENTMESDMGPVQTWLDGIMSKLGLSTSEMKADPYNTSGIESFNQILDVLSPNVNKGMNNTQLNVKPTTQLDLSITSNTQLIVDGRQMATVVKSYLESDMLRAEESSGSIFKNIII